VEHKTIMFGTILKVDVSHTHYNLCYVFRFIHNICFELSFQKHKRMRMYCLDIIKNMLMVFSKK